MIHLSWIHTSQHTPRYVSTPATHKAGIASLPWPAHTSLHRLPSVIHHHHNLCIFVGRCKEIGTISLSSCFQWRTQPSASYVSCLPNARRRRYFKAREAADSLLRETTEVAAIGVWCVMWIHNILLSFRIFLSPYVVCQQFTSRFFVRAIHS